MKTCFKCNETKPEEEFYSHPAMTDGRLGKCKTCAKRDVKARYRVTIRERHAYDRKRTKRPERRKAKLGYQRTSRAKDKQKNAARAAVGQAIKRGTLVRLPCRVCGDPKSEAHHADYGRPLEVDWLCFKHHREHGHGQTVLAEAA